MNDEVTVQKESYIDEARRRIAHLSHKLENDQEKIRVLEYDNAELQRWVNDECLPRLRELNDELVTRYNQKKYRSKNFNNLQWKEKNVDA